MKSLGNIFGTVARTDILRALYYQPEPVGLRYLARIADIHPHSAELALAALAHEQLVIYGKVGRRKLYELNMRHEDYISLVTSLKLSVPPWANNLTVSLPVLKY